MDEQIISPEDRRQMLPIPRWEVVQMMAQAIDNYDKTVCGPRLKTMTDSLEKIECLLDRIAGAMQLIKWVGASAGALGVIYKVVSMHPHL